MLSFCLRHKVILSLVRPASVVTFLSRSLAKWARHGISVSIFSTSLLSSSTLSVQFHSIFFWRSCHIRSIFSESWRRNFAKFWFAPRIIFRSLLDLGGFNCTKTFIFSLFSFNPRSVISYPSQIVSLRKISVFFSLDLYPASSTFPSIVNIFFGGFLCTPLFLLI